MQNLKIEGMGTVNGGEYGTVSIEGMGKCNGDIKAETLTVEGLFDCRGSVNAGLLQCEGVSKIRGNIHADRINIEGVVTVSGGTKIEAAEIVCEGIITVDGEISADSIRSDGFMNAKEITGDNIFIRSRRHRFFGLFRSSHSRIDLIEATTIELRGVIAQSVNGRDIIIDSGCTIENLDCSGSLFISPASRVHNITGTYTKR